MTVEIARKCAGSELVTGVGILLLWNPDYWRVSAFLVLRLVPSITS